MKLNSPYSFTDTLARVRAALTAKGLTVFATIDHQANARAIGLDMPPATVLIYGNPRTGTPLMVAAPDAALDLPLHVLISADADGHTVLVYDTAVALEARGRLPVGLGEVLAPAEKLLAAAIQ